MKYHEQCGAAEGMACVKGDQIKKICYQNLVADENNSGQCQCIEGFSPAMDVISHPSKNPSQQCQRDCEKVHLKIQKKKINFLVCHFQGSSLSRDTSCLGKAQLGAPCFVQEQCPEHAGCYRGRCLCRCGFKMTAQNKCIPLPPPSTPRPQTVPSAKYRRKLLQKNNFSCAQQS